MKPYKTRIARKFLDALHESKLSDYKEWCGCDLGIPLLEIRLECESITLV